MAKKVAEEVYEVQKQALKNSVDLKGGKKWAQKV
jgi:hypothetical protein